MTRLRHKPRINPYTELYKKALPNSSPGLTTPLRASDSSRNLHLTPLGFLGQAIEKSFQEDRTSSISRLSFKSVLIEGPSGSGLSTTLLQHAYDHGPAIYIVDNINQYQYFTALMNHLRPDSQDSDFEFISSSKKTQLRTNKYIDKSKKEDKPKIYFVTLKTLQNNLGDLKKLVKELGIKNFYYDNVNKLKYDANSTTPNASLLCELMSATDPEKGLPCLLGSINYPHHFNLHGDFFYKTDATLGQLFPSSYRFSLSSKPEDRPLFGLAATFNTIDKAIRLPAIQAGDNGLITVDKILRGKVRNSETYIERIVDQLLTLSGRIIVRTNSPDSIKQISEALKRKLGDEFDKRVKAQSTSPISSSFEWFFDDDSQSKILLSTNGFNQIHLPLGSYQYLVYLDAPESSTALANAISPATSDPGVRIISIKAANANRNHTYKFIGVHNYKPVDPSWQVRNKYKRNVIAGFPYAEIINQIFQKAEIKDQRAWSGFLLPVIGKLLGEKKHLINNWVIVKNFIELHSHNLPEAEIISVIKGDIYNPQLFRKFMDFLFNPQGAFVDKLNHWYTKANEEQRDSLCQKTGLKNFSAAEIKRNYPELTGVFGLEEAQAVLNKFSPIYDFALDAIEGLNMPAGFTYKEKADVLLALLEYLKIDKEELIKELNLDRAEIGKALQQCLENEDLGALEAQDLEELSSMIVNYKLLTKLFPDLALDLNIGDYPNILEFTITDEEEVEV